MCGTPKLQLKISQFDILLLIPYGKQFHYSPAILDMHNIILLTISTINTMVRNTSKHIWNIKESFMI